MSQPDLVLQNTVRMGTESPQYGVSSTRNMLSTTVVTGSITPTLTRYKYTAISEYVDYQQPPHLIKASRPLNHV